MVLWVRFEIYDILSQWSHMTTLERPMIYKSLVYGLSVKTFLFLPSLPWMVWEPFKLLLLPTTIRATIRALPSAHYHPRTYVNTEGVTGVQFPPILGPATQTQGNSLQVSLSISGFPTCIDGCEGHHYVMNIIHFQAQKLSWHSLKWFCSWTLMLWECESKMLCKPNSLLYLFHDFFVSKSSRKSRAIVIFSLSKIMQFTFTQSNSKNCTIQIYFRTLDIF